MNRRPNSIDCPQWIDDIPRDLTSDYFCRLRGVIESIAGSAVGRILGNTELRMWHRRLFRRIAPLEYYAGNFRQDNPNMICLGVNVAVGSKVGVHFTIVHDAMNSLMERICRAISQLELGWPQASPQDRALKVALVGAELIGGFIRVHPFINGNGRVSRLLWRWALLRFGVPPQVRVQPRPDATTSYGCNRTSARGLIGDA